MKLVRKVEKPKETLSSVKYKTCDSCPHWGDKTKRPNSIKWCTLLRRKFNPLSSACFLADMTEVEAYNLGVWEK